MIAANDVDAALAAFPGPLAFAPSRKKWFWILAIGLVFTAIGVAMLSSSDPSDRQWAWLVIVFFGFGSATALAMLLPGCGGMDLNADGFTVINFYRRKHYRWTDVSDFAVVRGMTAYAPPMIVFNDRNAGAGFMTDASKALTKHTSALPDNYASSPDDLARLMSLWQQKALPRNAVTTNS